MWKQEVGGGGPLLHQGLMHAVKNGAHCLERVCKQGVHTVYAE